MPRHVSCLGKLGRKYTKTLCFMGILVPMSFLTLGPAAADETFKPTARVDLGGAPLLSFDISFVDPTTGIYLLADRSHNAVDVIDTTTNTLVTNNSRFRRIYRE